MPNHLVRLSWVVLMLLVAITPLAAQDSTVDLEPITFDQFGIETVVPVGWQTAAPGVVARAQAPGDITSLIQQAAPVEAAFLRDQLSTQFGIEAFPEATETIDQNGFTWSIYQVELEQGGLQISVSIALAELDGTTYVILLQGETDGFADLYDSVFVPVLDAFMPVGGNEEVVEATEAPAEAADSAEDNVYTDPEGLYSVTIPNGWTATELEGYTALVSPEDEVITYLTTAATDDPYKAIEGAWALANPDFDQSYDEDNVNDTTDPALVGDVERAVVITYLDGTGDDGVIVQGIAQVYEGTSYVLLVETTLEAAQRRQSQFLVLNTGWKILAIDETDLSSAEALPIDETIIAELESYIEGLMEQVGTPGLTIAIVQDGEVVYTNGFGVRDFESNEPVASDTRMMIGSTGKSMTTMLMGTFVDDGLLDWDQPVVEILPEFAVADEELTQTITVQNLVCACTGVPRRDLEVIFNFNELSAEDVVESLATFEFFTDFGEAFQYSNQLVATGGYVAAAAGGVEFGNLYAGYLDLMQERIFDPLGMARTAFAFDTVLSDDNFAQPYGFDLVGDYVLLPLEVENFVTPITPAGAVWSTAEDMAQYLLVELGRGTLPDGTQIISQANLERTWEPQVEVTSESDYGLGWFVETWNEIPVVQHGGNTLGFSSDFAFMPENGIGISVIVNERASLVPAVVRERLFELVFDQEPEIEAQVQAILRQQAEGLEERTADLEPIAPESDVETFAGTYLNEELGDMVVSVNDEGVFVLDVGEFQTELWKSTDVEDEIIYLMVHPPLEGLGLVFEMDDSDTPSIRLGAGQVEYIFVQE